MSFSNFDIITKFPDATDSGFCWDTHNKKFRDANVIIKASAKNISYKEHWGPLSIKTTITGKEHYRLNYCTYAVDENNYLIINNGSYKSSFIASESAVDSFTLTFTPDFVSRVITDVMNKEEFLLDNFLYSNKEINFYEKLYSHDTSVSPLLFKLRRLSNNFKNQLPAIEETFHLLLLKLLDKQSDIEKDVRRIKATKKSTKQELYKRLNRAKDLIDSCYYENLSLSNIASTCLLNETYLLRQFRTYFGITPRQYVIQKRMEAARQFVECDYDLSISEICLRVGYSDLTSFSKLYKKIYSYSPENYRGLYR